MIDIGEEDPTAPDVVAILEAHQAFALATTPPEHVYAMSAETVAQAPLTLLGARDGGALLGVGAIREFDVGVGEIKSMHTAAVARGRGVGRLLLAALLDLARARNYGTVLLETGSMPEMAPARALYESVGFTRCAPFGHYGDNGINLCYSLSLEP